MTWLVTGGAGFIGAHVVRALTRSGQRVVVYDDASAGVLSRLPSSVPVVLASTLDRAALDRAIAEHEVGGVVHLAARKQVGESVEQPLRYYRENVGGLGTVLEAAVEAGVERLVFSSSAAVYGAPESGLVTEAEPCRPMSPYGESKLAGEWLTRAAGRAHKLSTVCLRYFNVAGAAEPELADTGVFNIIPMVFERLTAGEAPVIFGADYPTPDGTCVRDYIHVEDLADAHLAAVRATQDGTVAPGTDLTVNVGSGEGVSVRELVTLIGEVTGHDVEPVVSGRRAGDPPTVVASAGLAGERLGWRTTRGVREMVESAWEGWCLRHPEARRA
jgi:UDP-glucose 4-epimerase